MPEAAQRPGFAEPIGELAAQAEALEVQRPGFVPAMLLARGVSELGERIGGERARAERPGGVERPLQVRPRPGELRPLQRLVAGPDRCLDTEPLQARIEVRGLVEEGLQPRSALHKVAVGAPELPESPPEPQASLDLTARLRPTEGRSHVSCLSLQAL